MVADLQSKRERTGRRRNRVAGACSQHR